MDYNAIEENRFKKARRKGNKNGFESVPTVEKNTGISHSQIDDLESSVGKPRGVSYQTVAKLAKYYGVSADYLLGLSEQMHPDINIRFMCEYLGLSEEAVKLLHHLTAHGNDEEQRTISFINRVLSDPDNAPGRKLIDTTLFSWLEQYVTFASVKAYDLAEHKLVIAPGMQLSSGFVEGLDPKILSGLYKELIMNRVKGLLDQYCEEARKNEM